MKRRLVAIGEQIGVPAGDALRIVSLGAWLD